VLKQNYPNFEHIIIDGGSTDGTVEILKQYPHLKWISEPDEGQSDALNKGFKMASGELLGWLNTDEFYLPNVFQVLSKWIEDEKNFDVYFGDVVIVNSDADFIKYRAAHLLDRQLLLYYGPYISTTSFFIKRRIIEDGIMINNKYNYIMDGEYFLRLSLLNKRFLYIPQAIGVFRWTGNNKSLEPNNEGIELRRRYGSYLAGTKVGAIILNRLSLPKRLILKCFTGGLFREIKYNKFYKNKNMKWF
jgi:glycosyltransferase involved in cell wall biosynthesis